MRRRLTRVAHATLLVGVLMLALQPASAPAAPNPPGPGVAWLTAAGDADVDGALARARAERKPVLLYWGAKWCPPCNQLKATLFNRQDFIGLSKNFVAVHVDGDLPGAQKLGTRFKVRGYPTMILMAADGREITRLPGEADAPQVMAMLQQGLAGGRSVKAVLADARAGKPLVPNEWRALALYSWGTDQEALVPEADRAGVLAQLAAAVPPAETEAAARLLLKALAESDEGKGLKPDAATAERVKKLLADPAAARAQIDTLVNYPDDITRALAPEPGAERQALVTAFDAALKRLQSDATLSRADRQSALLGRISLARLDGAKDERHPTLDAGLLKDVKDLAARDDREITDGYERQAVITSAAYALGQAGLWADSDALLKANLAKSHSPYYLMSQLAGNARKRGDNPGALRWYEQAYKTSEGPATRLQWGSSYVGALVDLAPADAARIEQAAGQLIAEAGQDGASFHERSAASLQRMAKKLMGWNAGGTHDAVMQRLQTKLDGVCARIDAADAAQRSTCENLLRKSGA
jgi:thioredoxin-like negative regulator of GroEL